MRVGIFSNEIKDSGNEVAIKLSNILKNKDIDAYIFNNADRPYLKTIIQDTEIDILAVLGGDGTILGVVPAAALNDIPILGINMGRIGFLTELEKDEDWNSIIDNFQNGNYSVDERTLLEVTDKSQSYLALNEVLISRNEECCVSTIDVYIDDVFLDRYVGDGLLISTPTGSTGYSLSAGGPILSPDIEAIVINAVCPHSLHNRPIVTSDKHNFRLKLISDRISAKVSVDGRLIAIIDSQDIISVNKSDKKAKFIRFNELNFYKKLLIKMNYWSNIKEIKE